MATRLDVRHRLREAEERYGLLARERKAAAVRAANRATTTARAEASRTLHAEYRGGLKISEIKSRIHRVRATSQSPVAELQFSGRRIALFDRFGMRKVGRWGARFSRLPWRLETVSGEPVTPEMLARAFRQNSRTGKAASKRAVVMARKDKSRLSHEVLVAPGIARAAAERAILDATRKVMRERFMEVFDHEVQFQLLRRKGR